MWKKVRDYIRSYGMLESGGRVIAAVSGGADSVCLLSVLCRLSEEFGIRMRAVHVHHGLRGAEADRDEQFVRQLCGRLQVPLTVVHRDVAGYARGHGLSTEEAGRILRYEAFEEEAARWQAEESGSVKIAVAHHQDDSAETILYHLVRGSGLKGLSGIRPVQGNRIRPLLCVSRQEILAYLSGQNLDWCEDSTNLSDGYTRNRIRNRILPLLTETVNARAAENILHAGEIFAQADQYLERQAEEIWRAAGARGEETKRDKDAVSTCAPSDEKTFQGERGAHGCRTAEIRLDAFLAQPDIIRTYLIRRMLNEVTPEWKNITARHFRQIEELAKGQVGKRCSLPCGMWAARGYEVLKIGRGEKTESGAAAVCSPAQTELPMEIPLPAVDGGGIRAGGLLLQAFPRKKQQEIPKNQYTKWFDYDKIKDTLSVRYRQTGDYLTLPDGGKKAVTRCMIDEKIPREARGQIPVLAERGHILWVVGYRISEYYKITNTTRTILQVKANGGEEHGR